MSWRLASGATPHTGGSCEFRVWAPDRESVSVRIAGRKPGVYSMQKDEDGQFSVLVPVTPPGTDYCFALGDADRPDPASRWQPHGVHGPSRVVDPSAFAWGDRDWRGRPLREFIFYEAHVGTFTPEGTFRAAIARLPHLRRLGITALELMPVAEFPGARNWGYDGVSLYAPHSAYGGPDEMKALVDACHQQGIAFVLDVVYNHLGPEGNYLAEFGPYFTDTYRTPWGQAINFDGPRCDPVRRFFADNALYWLTEFHIDALRIDAIHGIFDFGARHFLDQLASEFHDQAAALGRQAWLIAESNLNDSRVVKPRKQGGFQVDAQWNDDFHHSLVTALAGPQPGYLSDFGSLGCVAKAITDGFVYDGIYSQWRQRRHGNSSKDLRGEALVHFIQNHDQVANAFAGSRLASLIPLEAQKLAAAVLVCSPALPLLFMGQEYGETAPFHYFTSHGDPDLVQAVREGRSREFGEFHSGAGYADPQDESTFLTSKLRWDCLAREPFKTMLRLYADLFALRAATPSLSNVRKDLASVTFDEEGGWLVLVRKDPDGTSSALVCNFARTAQTVPLAPPPSDNWSLALWTAAPSYGGAGETPPRAARGGVDLPPSSAALFRTGEGREFARGDSRLYEA